MNHFEDGDAGWHNSPTNGRQHFFKHKKAIVAGDVWSMRVTGGAWLGFATEEYDVRDRTGATFHYSTFASMGEYPGSTIIGRGISEDGNNHSYGERLLPYIPNRHPYDISLRITKDGNIPQIQFNNDDVWHDFAAEGEVGLNAGPWYPFMRKGHDIVIINHDIRRPKPIKSANQKERAESAKSASPKSKSPKAKSAKNKAMSANNKARAKSANNKAKSAGATARPLKLGRSQSARPSKRSGVTMRAKPSAK